MTARATGRLTPQQRVDRSLSEDAFAAQVLDLAAMFGWLHVHFRPAQTARGWRTPVSGPLGKGWPDYTFARPRDGRHLFAELKRETGVVDPDQAWVLDQLRASGAEVHVWRPSDLATIAEVLR